MKKPLLVLLIGSALTLSACGDKNYGFPQDLETQEYYVDHPDKIAKVIEMCESLRSKTRDIEAELESKEEKDAFWVATNKFYRNCLNAENALNKIEYKKQEEQQEKEKAEKQAQHKAELSAYIQEMVAKYTGLSWQQGITQIINTHSNFLSKYNYNYNSVKLISAVGVTMDSIENDLISNFYWIKDYIEIPSTYSNDINQYEEKWHSEKENLLTTVIYAKFYNQGINELLAKPYSEVVADKSYCKTDQRPDSVCDVWKQAVSMSRGKVVQNYIENYEQLKKDHNQCVAQLDAFLKSKGVAEGAKAKSVDNDIYTAMKEKEEGLYNAYPCSETKSALEKLNLKFDAYEELE